MPGGRPRRLNQRVTIPARPARDELGLPAKPEQSMTVADAIHERIRRTGVTPSLAGRPYASAAAIHKWVADGREQQARRDAGHRMFTPGELRCIEFVEGCDAAFADYVDEMNDLHDQLARGGIVIGKVTEKMDADGAVVERRVVHERSLPDVRAIQWNLERKARDEGFAPRVEVTGADGGPVQTEDTTRAKALELAADVERFMAAEAAAYLQGVADTEDALEDVLEDAEP